MGKSKELAELGQVVTQSNGNVGIGTDIPEQSLHIKGSNYNEQLVIERADTSSKWGVAGAGNGAFQVYDINSGNATRMTIDASGRVTMPYQPYFSGDGTNTGDISVSADIVWVVSKVYVNNGNHYNTSNGTFTAPVAGYYLCTFNSLIKTDTSSNDHALVEFRVNNIRQSVRNHTQYQVSRPYEPLSNTAVVYANTNDAITVVVGGSSKIYGGMYGGGVSIALLG